jgi:transcriptional regulatory protein GAL4
MPVLIAITALSLASEVSITSYGANLNGLAYTGFLLLARRLRESEAIRADMERAWKAYVPNVDLGTALDSLRLNSTETEDAVQPATETIPVPQARPRAGENLMGETEVRLRPGSPVPEDGADQLPEVSVEHTNAEDYEFDESHDVERAIDGMASLTADPHKAGYTGPQSGIAALKFLQSLPPYLPITYASPLPGPDDEEIPDPSTQTPAAIAHYIDEYFTLFHPAYPILHEGTFRARVSGKLCLVPSRINSLTHSRRPGKAAGWLVATLV